jgi:hypothetical protein
MSEWQPIETAPKDGGPILALSKDWPEEPYVIVRFFQGPGSRPYVWSRLNGDEAFLTAAFSHWMPLPKRTSDNIPDDILNLADELFAAARAERWPENSIAAYQELHSRISRAIMAERDKPALQPVDTAPKDGSDILGYGAAAYEGRRYAPGFHVCWWIGDRWQGRDPDENIVLHITHWMPLPKPQEVSP